MNKKAKKIIKKIEKGKEVKTPVFIEDSSGDIIVISCIGDFNMTPLEELTEKDKESIAKFLEEIRK